MDKPEDTQTPNPGGDSRDNLPPSLRSKMQFDDEPEEKKSNAANVIALVMLIAIVVLGGLFLVSMQKSKAATKAKAAADAKLAAEQARADSIAKAEQDSLFAARSDSIAKATPKKPAAKPAAAAGGSAAAGGTEAPPPPPSKFGIDAGSFLSEEAANKALAKVQGSGLAAKVNPVKEGDFTSYHLIVGEFSSKAEAEKKANDLIVAQTIREAHVIKLKPGS